MKVIIYLSFLPSSFLVLDFATGRIFNQADASWSWI